MTNSDEHNINFEGCRLCGSTGEVWDEDFVWIVTCPVCDGKRMVKVNEQRTTVDPVNPEAQTLRGGLFR